MFIICLKHSQKKETTAIKVTMQDVVECNASHSLGQPMQTFVTEYMNLN